MIHVAEVEMTNGEFKNGIYQPACAEVVLFSCMEDLHCLRIDYGAETTTRTLEAADFGLAIFKTSFKTRREARGGLATMPRKE